jgi:hexosaminidase
VRHRRLVPSAVTAVIIGGLLSAFPPARAVAASPAHATPPPVIPAPVSEQIVPGQTFDLGPDTKIVVSAGSAAAAEVGDQLADILRPSTGFAVPVLDRADGKDAHAIVLALTHTAAIGDEGYLLDATHGGVRLRANTPRGLFNAIQTLRQLLPAQIESTSTQTRTWTVPGVHIVDYPRYPHRGAMLDVARHFFGVADVEKFIDEISLYKINYLHLHLTDDQGWRLYIDSWPRLATYGGSREIGGGVGGYYTKSDFAAIVGYAAAHGVTIVPEIDMPSHMNAALASYGELTCDGVATQLPPRAGKGELCPDKPIVDQFVDDVIREVAAMTPGKYIDLGGDEPKTFTDDQYATFMERAIAITSKYGKTAIGWNDHLLQAALPSSTIVQYWEPTDLLSQQNDVIVSDRLHSYLNFRYDLQTPSWAFGTAGWRTISAQQAYDWNPDSYAMSGGQVLGTEDALWSENLPDLDSVEFMTFPRLLGMAEVGWSPASTHVWEQFRQRLADQAPRWDELGIEYYRSPDVPWSSAALPVPATASASCVEGDGAYPQFDSQYAVDGDFGTRWSSCRTDDAWLQAALPGATPVSEIVLHWQKAYGAGYKIQTSDDGVTWTTVATVSEGDGGMDVVRLDHPVEADYVRMQGVSRGTKYGYSLFEFDVFAAGAGS